MNVAVLDRASHANGVHGLRTEKVFITPQMAAVWLEKNIDNRNVIAGHLKSLETFFRRGEMKLNGQTIKFSGSGRLLDGQHRLMACANTGIGFWSLVVYGLEEEAFETIDVGGKPRRVQDVLGIRGEANAKDLAATVNAMHQFIETGGFYDSRNKAFSVAVADQIISRHPNIRDSVSLMSSKRNVLWRSSVCSCLHYLFSLSDTSRADEFALVLFEGSGDVDRPFNRFRESLIRQGKIKGRHSLRVNAARCIKAFNCEISGHRPKVMHWRDTEDFPQIEGIDYASL
jgi:hypothetical protein